MKSPDFICNRFRADGNVKKIAIHDLFLADTIGPTIITVHHVIFQN